MKRRMLIAVLILAGALFTAIARKETGPFAWPDNGDAGRLKFSHAYHVKEAGIACRDCHKAAGASKLSSDNLRPVHEDCATCHAEEVNTKCGFCHVNPDSIEPYVPPVRTLIFSHEQHLAMNDVQCTNCHTGLDTVTTAGPGDMPTMTACNTCHNDMKATNGCEACHTSFTDLVPSDHLVADFKKDHKKLTRLGALNVTCGTCHTQTFCADCHDAASLMQFGKGDLMSEPSPRNFPGDSPREMTLQTVHSLNYRFTHGVDAKARSSDCTSCHSAQRFCVECHTTGGNINEQAFKPGSHNVAGFTTLGVGSGGGVHAQLARRDIESCASCHDTQGSDPVCITCHSDPDGIRGTDPKTHPTGYMRNEHGPWHANPGATCYNCHTDFNARPDGKKGKNFCGYCHAA